MTSEYSHEHNWDPFEFDYNVVLRSPVLLNSSVDSGTQLVGGNAGKRRVATQQLRVFLFVASCWERGTTNREVETAMRERYGIDNGTAGARLRYLKNTKQTVACCAHYEGPPMIEVFGTKPGPKGAPNDLIRITWPVACWLKKINPSAWPPAQQLGLW